MKAFLLAPKVASNKSACLPPLKRVSRVTEKLKVLKIKGVQEIQIRTDQSE